MESKSIDCNYKGHWSKINMDNTVTARISWNPKKNIRIKVNDILVSR
jgi:hypothetical protein